MTTSQQAAAKRLADKLDRADWAYLIVPNPNDPYDPMLHVPVEADDHNLIVDALKFYAAAKQAA